MTGAARERGRVGAGGAALVTGASGGVGEAVARKLAEDGFEVWLGGRRRERLAALAAEVGAAALPFDIADEAEVAAARAAVGESLAVLVNAAGVFDIAPVAGTDLAVLRRNLEANLVGAFAVTRAFLPGMIAARSGLIVNVGSVAGWRAFPGNGAYSASKFGLRGFHDVLLEELRGTGVRATLLEPGAVDTAIWDPLDPDGDPGLPGRADMLRPEDVAEAVAFAARLPATVAMPLLRMERA